MRLQGYWLINDGSNIESDIVYISIAFSILSIAISILSMISQIYSKRIFFTQVVILHVFVFQSPSPDSLVVYDSLFQFVVLCIIHRSTHMWYLLSAACYCGNLDCPDYQEYMDQTLNCDVVSDGSACVITCSSLSFNTESCRDATINCQAW